MTENLCDMPLATLLATSERLFAGVMAIVELDEEVRWTAREKGAASPAMFGACISIPLCVVFLKELKRRGIPIPEQEWLIEVFDESVEERKVN